MQISGSGNRLEKGDRLARPPIIRLAGLRPYSTVRVKKNGADQRQGWAKRREALVVDRDHDENGTPTEWHAEQVDITGNRSILDYYPFISGAEAMADKTSNKPALLAGGNPQIAKADGDAPVQAYIAAMPGWKSDVGRRLDALVVRTVPGVRKAVKWNSPLYGLEGEGWFLGVHCFTKYVKVAFFRGTSLRPVPAGESKSKDTRYLDIHEDDQFDETQLAAWMKQASQLPGERM